MFVSLPLLHSAVLQQSASFFLQPMHACTCGVVMPLEWCGMSSGQANGAGREGLKLLSTRFHTVTVQRKSSGNPVDIPRILCFTCAGCTPTSLIRSNLVASTRPHLRPTRRVKARTLQRERERESWSRSIASRSGVSLCEVFVCA